MEQKIKIKIGSLEIEYEGSENYLKNDLPNLIEKLLDLNIPHSTIESIAMVNNENQEVIERGSTNKVESSISQMSANSIAAKLGGKKGTEVAIIGCAHLSLMQGLESFSRNQILTEMKKATNYYKSSYTKNLSNILKTLVNSHKLIERSNGIFALHASELNRIKNILNGN